MAKKILSACLTVALVLALLAALPPAAADAAVVNRYYQTVKTSVPLWSAPSSASTKVATLAAAGTVLYISSSTLNASSSLWYQIGSGAYKGRWVYSQNVGLHTHALKSAYLSKNDLVHTVTRTCTGIGCGYVARSEGAHSYVSGVCSYCGKTKVSTTCGYYATHPTSTPLYATFSSGSTVLATLPAGYVLRITVLQLNAAGNYWGQVGSGTHAGRWVYMGNLKPFAPRIALNRSVMTFYAIGSYTMLSTVSVPGLSYGTIAWTSSNPAVASVDATGRVVARSSGSATITARASTDSQLVGTCVVTVKNRSAAYLAKATRIQQLFITWSNYRSAALPRGYGYCTTTGAKHTCPDTACPTCNIFNVSSEMKAAGLIGYTISGGYTCNGFARFALRDMYGYDAFSSFKPENKRVLSTSAAASKKNEIILDFLQKNDARAGDLIYILRNPSSYHYMILLSYNAITYMAEVLDGNGDGLSGVQIRKVPFSDLYSRDSFYLVKVPDTTYELRAG